MLLKDKVKQVFYRKIPNSLRLEHVKFYFPNEDEKAIQTILDELVTENFLARVEERGSHPIFSGLPESARYSVRPEHVGKYPIETEINIDDFKMPRMLDGVSTVIAEDVNTIYEQFSKITDKKIEKLKEANQLQLKEFWGSLITIFGIFVTIFSLINVSIRPIYFSNELNLSSGQIFLQSVYNAAPLAITLLFFLLILLSIFRK